MFEMKHGSLFSGIGGIDLGFERAGIESTWQCEIDEKASEVLERRFPGVPNYHDVRKVTNDGTIESVDIISGGFPCQDVSVAGLQKGMAGEKSSLWKEFARIIREFRPRWVVAENVRGLLSNNGGRFFGTVLRDLASVGYDAEWKMLSAANFGAPHRRERIIIVAYPTCERLQRRFFEQDLRVNPRTTSTKFGNRDITCGGWWAENSANIRMGDGVPLRMARQITRQCGNAVVPQMAEWIGKRIIEVEQLELLP